MLIKRETYLAKIRPFYDLDIIKVLMGSRRCGKSKILELIIQELRDKGVAEQNIIFINFEDLQYDEINDYKKLNTYILARIKPGKNYLFFDEIHHVAGFEKAINSFRATLDCSIFITGSNSKMLSSEISSLLTGRIMEFTIYPFTYQESLEYRQVNNLKLPDNVFNDYLIMGGYPLRFNLFNEEDVKGYLKELFTNICQKDIFDRDINLEKEKFNKVCEYVLVNAGNDFNPESICDYLNSSNGKNYICPKTIYKYLDTMQKAFLITPVYRYNISGKAALKTNPKYYAIDNGLRLIKASSNNYNRGHFLENLLCIELLSRGYELYIGKTYKSEVDFIASKNGKKCFIQVAYIMESEDTINREFGAFSSIKDSSPKYVISLDPINMSRDGIVHLNIIDFLTNKVDLFLT
jgi:uncharacterized protein